MEKRIKATKIEVVPRQHQPTSNHTSSAQSTPKTTRQATNRREHSRGDSSIGPVAAMLIIGLVFAVNFCGGDGESSARREQNKLKESFQKIDRGEQLTPEEEKRLDNLLYSPVDGDN